MCEEKNEFYYQCGHMSLSKLKFRELVFQLLFSLDEGTSDFNLMEELMMEQLKVTKKNVRLAQEQVQKITRHLKEIDSFIASVSTAYDFNRIQTVTRNILRLSVYELFFDSSIPPKVVIAEGIRLSRKFNTPESASFVNALLDCLYQKKMGEPINLNDLSERSIELIQSEQISSQIAMDPPLNEQETTNP